MDSFIESTIRIFLSYNTVFTIEDGSFPSQEKYAFKEILDVELTAKVSEFEILKTIAKGFSEILGGTPECLKKDQMQGSCTISDIQFDKDGNLLGNDS